MSEMDERPTDRPLRPTHLVRVLVVVLVGLLLVLAWRAERPEAPDLPAALPAALPAGEEDEPRGGGSEKTSSSGHWKALVPRSGAERVAERLGMVAGQIENRRRGSWSLAVLEAMRTVPRHVFVPASHRAKAYRDSPLPIGFGQTISQPYIVALMTELLDVAPGDRILEIGTGSGYQAAVLAQLTPHVHSLEIVESLAERTRKILEREGYGRIALRAGDGYHGWPGRAPFDGIIVTCAAGHLPPPLWEQLAPGGRIVVPIGSPYEVQRLVVLTKTPEGRRRSRTISAVRFVPMTGRVQEE